MLLVSRFSVPFLFFFSGIVMFFSFQRAYSQAEVMADEYFAVEQFYKAAVLYEQVFQSDTTHYRAAFQLGECYRHLFVYEKAQRYYDIVQARQAGNFPLSVFYFALMLKYNQHFEEAVQQFDRFIRDFNHTAHDKFIDQARNEKQGCYLALLKDASLPNYHFYRLGPSLNTEYNEYAPAIFRHDSLLVITSSRVRSTKGKVSNRSGEGFTDNFMFEKTGEGWIPVKRNQHFNVTNTRWGDGSGCFNKEKDKYYYTSCGGKDGLCRIFLTTLKDGRWQEPVVLNTHINQAGSNAKHPALTAGGDTLFFVSDRRGGVGGTDIWMSVSSGNDMWGPAVNPGEKINTAFDEVAPFYESKEKLLIFASDGHEGMGGMDIFLAEGLGKQEMLVQNLGKPFNSSKDDCYLVLGDAVGYIASNRDESFDIYGFDKRSNLTNRDFLLGNFGSQPAVSSSHTFQDMITDAGIDFPLKDRTIAARSSDKERLRNGSTRFILSSDVDDILLDKFKKKARLEREQTADMLQHTLANDIMPELDSLLAAGLSAQPVLSLNTSEMTAPQKGQVTAKLFLPESANTLSAVTLSLVNSEGKLAKVTTTNEQGGFRFSNLEPNTVYHVFVDASSLPRNIKPAVKHVKLQAYGEEVSSFHYENIYFDFNQSRLRREARVVLDELADFYHRNPDIQIEINAFTDSTGNADYNLLLSQERGESAFDYLIENGVDRSAIVINAQGASNSIASDNPFVSQQLNRRVEFEVIGRETAYEPEYETHILKPKVTLFTLADELNMSIDELMLINGLNNEEIQAYKPIRVKKSVKKGEDILFYDITKK